MTTSRRQQIAWVAWTVLLTVSLVTIYVLDQRAAATGRGGPDGSSARFGFRLESSAKAAGIDFTHQGPTFDSRLEHIMPQVAAMGAAVAVADFDRDGWQDFYV